MARPGLRAHPKFRRLVHILAEPIPHAWGYLECLWEVGYQSGDPILGDALDVELAAMYPGEQGRLCQALLDCRLIDRLEDGRFQIHDLHENAPEYVTSRWGREQERKKPKACEACGTPYHSPDPRSKYCSAACRTRRYRQADKASCDGSVTDRDGLSVTVTDRDGTPAPAHAHRSSSSPDKPARKKKASTPKPRQRDDLFDAVAEITASDPEVSGSHIGKVTAALRKAQPPYTPQEVRAFPAALQAGGLTVPVTLGVVEKYIGWVRNPPGGSSNGTALRSEAERERKNREQLKRLREEESQATTPGKSLLARVSLTSSNGRADR